MVATIDEMSGGRIELGLGAGWHENEHKRHGFPFPAIDERASMLEETLQIVHGLWEEPDGWSFHGRFYTVEDARFRPKPASPNRGGRRPPILVGGGGSPRAMRLAARWADEFNLSSAGPDRVADRFRTLDEALRAAGRDPATLVHSVMAGVLVGRDEATVRRRQADLLAALGAGDAGDDWFATRRERWVFGTPEEARATVRRFEEAGAQRLMLQTFVPWDLDMIDDIAEALFPA